MALNTFDAFAAALFEQLAGLRALYAAASPATLEAQADSETWRAFFDGCRVTGTSATATAAAAWSW